MPRVNPKPCTCGGEAELMIQKRNGWVWVRCSKCNRQTKAFRSSIQDTTVQWAVSEWDFSNRQQGTEPTERDALAAGIALLQQSYRGESEFDQGMRALQDAIRRKVRKVSL